MNLLGLNISWTVLLFTVIIFVLWELISKAYRNLSIEKEPEPIKISEETRKHFQQRYESLGIFEYSEEGFVIHFKDVDWHCNWDNVESIFVYKQDDFTTDTICLDIFCVDGRSVGLNENIYGWHQFINTINTRFNINEGWWGKVAFPAFATNLTLIYNKHNLTQPEAEKLHYKNEKNNRFLWFKLWK